MLSTSHGSSRARYIVAGYLLLVPPSARAALHAAGLLLVVAAGAAAWLLDGFSAASALLADAVLAAALLSDWRRAAGLLPRSRRPSSDADVFADLELQGLVLGDRGAPARCKNVTPLLGRPE